MTTPIETNQINHKVGRHYPPQYHGYWAFTKGGFGEITKCDDCGATSLYEDAHPENPCRHCGGCVQEAGSGKWIPPVTRWSWFRRVVITPGYWLQPVRQS